MTNEEKMRVCFLCNHFEDWCSHTYCARQEDGTHIPRIHGYDDPERQRDGYEKACEHFELVELTWHNNPTKT